ncbi:MAG: hypothetical protein JNM78_13245 [Cyclobacteriaceae bacterium]|nr:hypothetical protein [Cyclobacteriaceae bacterium]
MPEMAMPAARAICPDKYRDPVSLLLTHGVSPDLLSGDFTLPCLPKRQCRQVSLIALPA